MVIVGELLFCSGCIIYIVLLTALLNIDDTCANARMPWSKMYNLIGRRKFMAYNAQLKVPNLIFKMETEILLFDD